MNGKCTSPTVVQQFIYGLKANMYTYRYSPLCPSHSIPEVGFGNIAGSLLGLLVECIELEGEGEDRGGGRGQRGRESGEGEWGGGGERRRGGGEKGERARGGGEREEELGGRRGGRQEVFI